MSQKLMDAGKCVLVDFLGYSIFLFEAYVVSHQFITKSFNLVIHLSENYGCFNLHIAHNPFIGFIAKAFVYSVLALIFYVVVVKSWLY